MEMHQLRYFIAVAQSGNFSRAAAQCRVAQPSISQQIQKLEDELGERLFDRLKREVKLTEHGEALLPRAIRILQEVDVAKLEVKDRSDLKQGRLAIGVLPTIAPYLLPKILADFALAYPGVDIVIREETTSTLLKLADTYEIDIALASLPIQRDDFEIRELFSEELVLALPKKHRLTKKHSIRLEDLSNEKFIVMNEGHCLGDQVRKFCDRRSFKPTITFKSAQLETVQALVAAGVGISLIPAMATGARRPDSPTYRSLAGPKPQRKVVSIWPKERPLTYAAHEFLKSDFNGALLSPKG